MPHETSVRFRAPTHAHNVIERCRLLDLLRESGLRRLTVIHAPAGYGRTTLAVHWIDRLRARGSAVAWLGLHRDDNDAHWFLSHLLDFAPPNLVVVLTSRRRPQLPMSRLRVHGHERPPVSARGETARGRRGGG